MELIETITVGAGGTSSIDFTNIPQDGTDLLAIASVAGNSNTNAFKITVNNNTSSIYHNQGLKSGGTSYSGDEGNNREYFEVNYGVGGDSSQQFGSIRAYIPNYTSNLHKYAGSQGASSRQPGSTFGVNSINASVFFNTNPITSLQFSLFNISIKEHSTISLYKITKA